MDDEFRIENFNNTNISSIDGIRVDSIVPGSPVENYNKTASLKIEVNDIITEIKNKDGNFVEVGYMRGEAPVNVLFLLPLSGLIQIKLRKRSENYSSSSIITIPYTQGIPEALDVQFSRNI